MKSWGIQPLNMPRTNDADSGALGLPASALTFHCGSRNFCGCRFVTHVATQSSSYSGRRQIRSPNKIPLTRIQVAEGQAGPNTSCTSSNHEGQGDGPNQIPRDRGPGGQQVGVWRWPEGVGTHYRAQEWPSAWDKKRRWDTTQTLERRLDHRSQEKMSKAQALKLGEGSQPSQGKKTWHWARALVFLAHVVLKAGSPQNLSNPEVQVKEPQLWKLEGPEDKLQVNHHRSAIQWRPGQLALIQSMQREINAAHNIYIKKSQHYVSNTISNLKQKIKI